MYRLCFFTFVFLLFGNIILFPTLLSIPTAQAQSPHIPAKKQNVLQNKKNALLKLKKQEKNIKKELTSLQKKLVNTTSRMQNNEQELQQSTLEISQLKEHKKRLDIDLENDRHKITEIIAILGRISRTPPEFQIFDENRSITDTTNTYIVLESILPRLQQKTQELQSKINKIKELHYSIEVKKEQQSERKEQLIGSETQLASLLKKRKQHYQKTQKQRKNAARQAKKLAKEAKNLKDLLAKLSKPAIRPPTSKPKIKHTQKKNTRNIAPSLSLSSGKKQLPARGAISVKFGKTNALGAKSKGITLVTKSKARVVSPLSGIVRFAGPFQKYNQLLIIEHKDGYHSLIAGLSHINTEVGTQIIAGEPIGIMGEKQHNLYYELRLNGQPINPKKLFN